METVNVMLAALGAAVRADAAVMATKQTRVTRKANRQNRNRAMTILQPERLKRAKCYYAISIQCHRAPLGSLCKEIYIEAGFTARWLCRADARQVFDLPMNSKFVGGLRPHAIRVKDPGLFVEGYGKSKTCRASECKAI